MPSGCQTSSRDQGACHDQK